MRAAAATRRPALRGALLAAGLLLAAAADAQVAGWEVRTIGAGREAKMPWVSGPDAAIAARIDALLFLDVLAVPPPKGERPTTFALPTRDGAIAPVTPSGFRVLRRDDRVLSLVVHAEGCGAYCEEFESPFLFDLATGRRVTDRDLLTAQGLRDLARQGLRDFVAAIGRELDRMKLQQQRQKQAKRPPKNALSDDEIEDRRALYTACRHGLRSRDADGGMPASLRIVGDGAELVFGRCSNHAMRALDDLGEHTWRVAAAELVPHLTPYGRRLLRGDGDAAAPTSPLGQVFAGTVGGVAVRLATTPPRADGSFSGTYYYERYRKPIELGGRFAGNTWTLTESSGDPGASAAWTLTRDGAAWAGSWVGADGRRLPVRLAP